MMKKIFIYFLLYVNIILAYDIDIMVNNNNRKKIIDISKEANTMNYEIKDNSEKISNNQLKFISKLLSKLFAYPVNYSLSMAQSYCYSIKDKDQQF
jgi:hypothetical protein